MPSSWWDHQYSHKEKKYSCTVCDRKFNYKSGIQLHKTVHLKQRLFKCFTGSCMNACKWRQDLHRHIQWHIEVIHHCKLCKYTSSEERIVRRHQVVHKDMYKYYCARYPMCPFKSKYYTSNQWHLVWCQFQD